MRRSKTWRPLLRGASRFHIPCLFIFPHFVCDRLLPDDLLLRYLGTVLINFNLDNLLVPECLEHRLGRLAPLGSRALKPTGGFGNVARDSVAAVVQDRQIAFRLGEALISGQLVESRGLGRVSGYAEAVLEACETRVSAIQR